MASKTSKISGKKKAYPVIPPDEKDKLTWAQRKQLSKEMYFNYTPLTVISRDLKVVLPTIRSWVYGLANGKKAGWKVERELSQNNLLKDLSSDKRGMVKHMVNSSLYLLHDYVEKARINAVKTGEAISIKDAEKITNMLMNLNKIVQDEKSNDANDDPDFDKPTNPEELTNRVIKADPFSKKVIDVSPSDDEDEILEEDIS